MALSANSQLLKTLGHHLKNSSRMASKVTNYHKAEGARKEEGSKYRGYRGAKRDFTMNFKTSTGAVTDPVYGAPDYSCADGSPVPLGNNMRRKVERQHELVSDVMRMLNEIEYAKTRHALLQEQHEAQRQKTISGKFNSKTHMTVDKEEPL